MNSVKKGDCVELLCRADGNIRLEDEVVLPDYCSDISKLVRLEAHPILEKTRAYIQENCVCVDVSGRVELQAIFTNEDGECETYAFSKDFSESCKKALGKGEVCAPDSLSAAVSFTGIVSTPKALSPRKILARSEIGICFEVFGNLEYSCYNPSEDMARHRIEPLKKQVGICRIIANKNEDFSLTQQIKLPSSMPPCQKVLSCNVSISVDSAHPSADEVSLFSTLNVNVFYLSEPTADKDAEYVSFYQPIEVKEKIELDDCAEDSVCRARGVVGKIQCTPVADSFGDNKLFSLSVGYSMFLCVMENVDEELVVDAYGVGAHADCKYDSREFYHYHGSLTQSAPFREKIALKSSHNSVCAVSGRALFKTVSLSKAEAFADMCIEVFAATCDENCKIDSTVNECFDTRALLNVPDSILKNVSVENLVIDGCACLSFIDASLDGASLDVSGEILITAQIFEKCRLKFINDAELSQGKEKKQGIVFYYPQESDTLWSVGKHYGVELEALKEINKIEDNTLPEVIRIP